MKGQGRVWTDAERASVAVMLRKGISMGKIARKLGLSRNSVIGRVSRDGELHTFVARIVMPVVPPLRPIQAKPPPSGYIIRAKRKARTVPAPLPSVPPTLQAQLMQDLRRDACRWPIGEATGVGHFLFCACVRRDRDTSYCAYHHAMAHQAVL